MNATEAWKPFNYLNPDNILIDRDWEEFSPQIHVQSVFGEGIGWEGMHKQSESDAFHVVISVTGKDPLKRTLIPLSDVSIFIKTQYDLPCIVEEGNGDFDNCALGPIDSRIFKTNKMGRISFSVPIDGIMDLESSLPPILIQNSYMDSDEWIVAHIDGDLHWKLSNIKSSDILKLNSNLNQSTASEYSDSISVMMQMSQDASPDESHKIMKRDDKKVMGNPHDSQNFKHYESTYNYARTYLVKMANVKSPIPPKKILIGQVPTMIKRNTNFSNLIQIRDSNVILNVRDENEKWGHKVISTINHAWKAVVVLIKQLGIALKSLFKFFRDAFKWEDISNTVQFLSLYYRRSATRSILGLEIIRDKYQSMLRNITEKTDEYFTNSLKNLGVENLSMFSIQNSKLRGNSSSFESIKLDAKTSIIQDRVINNIPNLEMESNDKDLFERLLLVMKQGASSLNDAIDIDELKKAMPYFLKFKSHSSLVNMGLAQLINTARTLTLVTEQVAGNIYAAVLQFIPIFWNLAIALMSTEIKVIPFLHNFWRKKFNQRSNFSILDLMCFMGGSYGTMQYKVYNNGVGPFSKVDIDVLTSAPSPELFLYTWNHDHRTSAVGNTELQNHRLGVYDWIPKCNMLIVLTFMTVVYTVPLMIADRATSNVAEPGVGTYVPMLVNAVVEMMGPISQYPFNQLETDDPVVMKHSLENPDPRYLGYWYSWIIELFVRSIRPFLSIGIPNTISPKTGLEVKGKSIWLKEPLFGIVNFAIVGGPVLYFGVQIQIDSAKTVSKADHPRQAVLMTGWAEISCNVFANFLPLIPDVAFGLGEVGTHIKTLVGVGVDILKLGVIFVRLNLLIGNNIVGMLSSSFQPKNQ